MSLAMDAVRIRPLSPVLAAEVIGLDLSQPLDEPTRRELYDAFVRYQVLCFRDQRLGKDQQIAFTEQFGTLERHIARNRGTDNPLVHTVSNLGPDGKPSGKVGSQDWHTDKAIPASPTCMPPMRRSAKKRRRGWTAFGSSIAGNCHSKSMGAPRHRKRSRTRRR